MAGLVYIAALAPDETETSQGQQDKFPVTDVFLHIEVADGRIEMLPSAAASFAGDLPEQEQELVWATHVALGLVQPRRPGLHPDEVTKLINSAAGACATNV